MYIYIDMSFFFLLIGCAYLLRRVASSEGPDAAFLDSGPQSEEVPSTGGESFPMVHSEEAPIEAR